MTLAIIHSDQFTVNEKGLCAQSGNNLYPIDGLAVSDTEIKGYQNSDACIVHYITINHETSNV